MWKHTRTWTRSRSNRSYLSYPDCSPVEMESVWGFLLSAAWINTDAVRPCLLSVERSAATAVMVQCCTIHSSEILKLATAQNLYFWESVCTTTAQERLGLDWEVASSSPLTGLEKCGDGKWMWNTFAHLRKWLCRCLSTKNSRPKTAQLFQKQMFSSYYKCMFLPNVVVCTGRVFMCRQQLQ